jgi:putative ABC transport system ATP-binding protein
MTTSTTISNTISTTPDTRSAARAESVSKSYGEGDAAVHALDDVSVSLNAGEFTAIMGPSGSGKSTLLHVLAGLDRPTSGEIYVGETEITRLKDKALTLLRRDQIGFIFQSFNLLPTLTAAENIVLPIRIAGRKPDEFWVQSIVETVGLTERLSHRPSQLSGGQQQRALIARALAGQPDLFFLDEPTAGVDLPNQQALADALGTLKSRGSTIVLVAHELGAMAPLVDRAVVMRDGRVAYDGEPLADHEVHHPDFGEAHTHHHTEPVRRDHSPHVGSPLDRGAR